MELRDEKKIIECCYKSRHGNPIREQIVVSHIIDAVSIYLLFLVLFVVAGVS